MAKMDYTRAALAALAAMILLAASVRVLGTPREVNAYGQDIAQAVAEEAAAFDAGDIEEPEAEGPVMVEVAEEAVSEPEQEPEPEPVAEAPQVWEAPVAYTQSYTGYAANSYDNDFRSQGVVYGEDGTRYTWYSQRALPGSGLTELNSNGRTVNDQGYVVDADGYIAVATRDYERGTVIETPFGDAKVYDWCPTSGTVDVYTDF